MVNAQPFGRRINPQHQRQLGKAKPIASSNARSLAENTIQQAPPMPELPARTAVYEEAREDDPAGNAVSHFPWRQLALMSSLCFGIASFVLPDSVNDPVQWLLVGLTVASLYAGLRKRITAA